MRVVGGTVVYEGVALTDEGIREQFVSVHLMIPTPVGSRVLATYAENGQLVRVARDLSPLGLSEQEVRELPSVIRRFKELGTLDDAQRALFAEILEAHRRRDGAYQGDADWRRQMDWITRALAGDTLPINDDDTWAEAARRELPTLPEREAWIALWTLPGDGSRPSKKWLKEGRGLIERIGEAAFVAQVRQWFALVTTHGIERDPTTWYNRTMGDANADALRAMVWACATIEDEQLAATVGDLAVRCFSKIRGIGALSLKVGNACIYVLSQLPGLRAVAQLSRLSARVRYKQALTLVDKAKLECAQRAGMAPIDLEELAVPSFGLDATGRLRIPFGEQHAAELVIDGDEVELVWFAGDKPLKSVPAEVKQEHGEALKELKATHKELAALLPGIRARLERWMLEPRRWRLDDLRLRYLDHPIVSQLARRLIWLAGDRALLFSGGEARDVNDQPVALAGDDELELWHPLGRSVEEILAWRARLEALELTQPFKQAHREVYLLTDAERATETYSNRFAAHIIKQHQFAALCRARGWTFHLMGQWDSHNTPFRELPAYGLRVELWVNYPGDGTAVSESGIYQVVATDQVRFVRGEGPLRLAEVPARCFSEIMRDVDLFVGVCSVGADPAWSDQGTRDYWQAFSWGELTASGESRKEVLAGLIPRLKIKDRLRLDGRFLHVRGNLGGYKIHLGSGNIMLEPEERYLCIVPDRGTPSAVRLPFEGDGVLSVVLSKAFLLAADDKIKDPAITSQLRPR